MSATGSIALVGTLTCATTRREQKQAISQSISDIEVKQFDVHLGTSSSQAVNLNLSSGVVEALVLAIYAPKKIIVEFETTDTDNAGATDGPVRMGVLGFIYLNFSPGEGLKTLTLRNLSTTDEVTAEVTIGAVENINDTPTFYV